MMAKCKAAAAAALDAAYILLEGLWDPAESPRRSSWALGTAPALLQDSNLRDTVEPGLPVTCFFWLGRSTSYLRTGRTEKESEVALSCLTLWDPVNYSLPGSSVHGIFQARVLEWVAISFSKGFTFWPRHWTQVSHIAGRCFTVWATRELVEVPLNRIHLDSALHTSLPSRPLGGSEAEQSGTQSGG